MCCFTGPVEYVSNTRIFARMGEGVQQFLAYSMHFSATEKLAMVLPLPVVKGSGEDALTFLNLEKYSQLFDDISHGFPVIYQAYRSAPGEKSAMPVAPPQLKVVEVGAFDASFVPTIADFSRLDKRFRLPDDVWGQLPAYADYGFAVFKLKPTNAQVHPMAFTFPSAHPEKLFFPTLHIHDGQVHAKEEFDHTLYCQGTSLNSRHWEESPGIASQFVKVGKSQGLVSPEHHVYRLTIQGMHPNGDVTAKAGKLVG